MLIREDLTGELRAFLIEKGADLVGFGSMDRLEGAPEIVSPHRYLPDAVSMISIGLHINEAVCDLITRSVVTGQISPSYHSYQTFTLSIINPQLDVLAYIGAKFLEHRGHRAYPFPANIPHILKPTKEYPGGHGDISHKHVAVICGLGDIGWHNLLITPRYGVRQKLTTILTNAPLEPDPILETKMCEPESCGFQCALACPTNAIPKDIGKKTSFKIGGKVVEYAKIDGWRCRWGCSGMLRVTGGHRDIPMPDKEPTDGELLDIKRRWIHGKKD